MFKGSDLTDKDVFLFQNLYQSEFHLIFLKLTKNLLTFKVEPVKHLL